MRKLNSKYIQHLTTLFLLFLITGISIYSQTPSTFNYQAVLRDGDGNIRADASVSIEFVIHQGTGTGTSVYDETFNISTNSFGLVNIEVGSVDPTAFALIDWSNGPYFFEVRVDNTSMGASQLLSVPYALQAASVDAMSIEDADADPTNEIQSLFLSGTNLTLSLGGGTVTLPTTGGGDNWGTQVVQSNATLTGEGTTASPLGVQHNQLLPDWDNIQDIPSGFDDGIDDVDDADADPVNELQTISINADELTLSDGGGTVTLPSGSGGGDITEVIAGRGLEGGGSSGSVTLDIAVPMSIDYGDGFFGFASHNAAVWGSVPGNTGILGHIESGVHGHSSSGSGVYGESYSGYGVLGFDRGSENRGFLGGSTTGVYGWGAPYAGIFDGDVDISGHIYKGGGQFKIDHPLDPANKFLSHSFVESPDMMNIYNGNVILDTGGEAVIELPEWFEALNKDFRYQLTCIGGFANVFISQKIENNQFKIAGGSPGLEVSWQVTGVRKDAYANMNRVQVEQLKEGDERGKYLHPEAFGLPESMGIAFERFSFIEDKQDTSGQ